MEDKIVIVDGLRTPFMKAGTDFNSITADELGRLVLSELVKRTELDPDIIDEVVLGNVAGPAEATNISRIIALKAGLPQRIPAYTVGRNCASGMEAIAQAYMKIGAGFADVVAVGGVESMSNVPVFYPKKYADKLGRAARAKTLSAKIRSISAFRPSDFKPVIGILAGLIDGYCGLNMGETAEVLAREFSISRDMQDEYALQSNLRAEAATEKGILSDEIMPVHVPPDYKKYVEADNGIRNGQTLEALARLKPVFDRRTGTVTAGNSSQITDGAVALIVMSAGRADDLGLEPLGQIRSFAFAGLDPKRMGLGPAYASYKALDKGGVELKDVDLIEINEAFAVQVIANEIAFASKKFAEENLDRAEPLGELDREKTNVNGGAISLGHPVGATGARLVLTLLKEMERKDLSLGLATLCIGGGQGGAILLERV